MADAIAIMEGLQGTVTQTEYDDFIEHLEDAVSYTYNRTGIYKKATYRDIVSNWHCTHWGPCDWRPATGEKQLKIALEYKCNQPGFDLNSTAFIKKAGRRILISPILHQVANDYSGTGEVFIKDFILCKYRYKGYPFHYNT